MLKKIIKFGLVGCGATLIDFMLLYCLKSLCDINVYVALTVSFIISLIFNYFFSMKYVFQARVNCSAKRQIIIFIGTAVIGLFLNESIMKICLEYIHFHYMIGKTIATGLVMIFNFISRYLLLE